MTAAEQRPAVFLISGPMAAGKTTVARLLAERFPRGVHLEGDVFRRSVVSGRVELVPDPPPEALAQLELRYRLGAAAADLYAEAGFTVALEDVVAGPPLAAWRNLVRSRPCHVVVLLPSLAAVEERDAARERPGYGAWTAAELHEGFASGTPRVGTWIDSSGLTPAETVDAILERTEWASSSSRRPIAVVDYDESWPELFEQLAAPVRAAVAGLGAEVEHVGSTAVPGLAAKPVIDVDVVVRAAEDVPAAVERLRGLGYVWQGDKGIPGREAFLWPPGTPPHHLYVVVSGSPPHRDHVDFRERLRRNPDEAEAYAALKRSLAERHRDDRLAYGEAKAEFVAGVLRAARAERE